MVYLFIELVICIVLDFIKINVVMNWYFIVVSVVVLFFMILLVIIKFIIFRLGKYDDSLMYDDYEEIFLYIIDKEVYVLKWVNISFIVIIILLIIIVIFEYSFLRNVKIGSLLDDVLLINGVGLIIFVVFLVFGLVYGILSKEIKNIKDLGKMFGDVVGLMGIFIVIVFFVV